MGMFPIDTHIAIALQVETSKEIASIKIRFYGSLIMAPVPSNDCFHLSHSFKQDVSKLEVSAEIIAGSLSDFQFPARITLQSTNQYLKK